MGRIAGAARGVLSWLSEEFEENKGLRNKCIEVCSQVSQDFDPRGMGKTWGGVPEYKITKKGTFPQSDLKMHGPHLRCQYH